MITTLVITTKGTKGTKARGESLRNADRDLAAGALSALALVESEPSHALTNDCSGHARVRA